MKKVIIFGAQGLLGTDMYSIFTEHKEYEVIPLSHFNYNILLPEELKKVFEMQKPDIVINCSGFTDVDSAELPENEELVYGLNADAPAEMAKICSKIGAQFVHFSTDYVFDGVSGEYDECAQVHPINLYGDSKVEGEMAIWEVCPNAIVIRTSRLFGKGRDNFVTKIASLAKKNKEILAISDERGHYTYTVDLANAVYDLVSANTNEYGVFHLFGASSASPYQVAKEIILLLDSTSPLIEILGKDLQRTAKRPQNCSLVNTRTKALPHYSDSLKQFFLG